MNKISKFFRNFLKLVGIIFAIACLCYGACHFFAVGYNYAKEFYLAHKPLSPAKFADPERYFIVEEIDTMAVPLRSFVFDIESRKAFDIEDDNDVRELVFTLGVDSLDYERIYAGQVTDKDIEGYKFDLKWALHEDEMEFCHTSYDEDGNIIKHYHTINDQVVEPSEKCDKCFGLIKYESKL